MYQYLDEFDQSLNIRLRRERSRSVVSYKEDNDHDDEDLKKRRYSAGSRRTPVSDLTSSLSTDFFDFSSCGDRRSEKNMKFIEAVVNTTLKYHHKFVKGSGRKQANQFVWDSIIDDLLKNYPQFNAPEIRKLTQRVWAWQKNKVWYAFTHSESNTLTEMEQRIKMALLSNSSGSSMTAPLSRASSVFEGVEFDNNDEEPYGDFDAPRFSFAERKYLICELFVYIHAKFPDLSQAAVLKITVTHLNRLYGVKYAFYTVRQLYYTMQKMTKDRQNKAHEVVEPEQQLLCGKILPGGDNFMKQCIISKVPENKR